MTEPDRHELNQFLCNRCNKPDAELFGMMVSSKEGRWVSYEDYARLKAEVERLTLLQAETLSERNKAEAEVERLKAEPDALTAYLYADTLRRDDIKTLKAHIERLTKAGDDLAIWLGFEDPDSPRIEEWHAAKEGKQSNG